MRAQQRFLGLHLPASTCDADHAPLDRLRFAPLARQQLQHHLYLPGRLRGGLLFGAQVADTLHVELATPMGLPWWYPPSRQAPLQIDERYALGWSDCLQALHGGRLDWVGNWLAHPDSQLPDLASDLAWLRRGARTALFDAHHVLLVVGWSDGSLSGRAYIHDFGTPVQLDCDLGGLSGPPRGIERDDPAR